MAGNINLSEQPERIRVSFYGALFAIAAADGTIDKDESSLIFESLDYSDFLKTDFPCIPLPAAATSSMILPILVESLSPCT